MHLHEQIKAFGLDTEQYDVQTHAQGHINDTFFVQNSSVQYVLQRINHTIFNDVPALMTNIDRITQHLQQNHIPCLRLNRTIDDQLFFHDDDGCYWRLYDAISNTQTINIVTDPVIAETGAFAFGDFVHQLSSLDPSSLHETIPHFLDLTHRHQQLTHACEQNPLKRYEAIKQEITHTLSLAQALLKHNAFPMRITHNDTKMNNVLFSEDWKALCVIDLDTTMPGSIIHDFSDLVRCAAHQCPEDSPDPSKAVIDLSLFEALYRGYLSGLQGNITALEKTLMIDCIHIMPVMLAMRFYTDYVLGDLYFKTTHEQHNLHRARVQVHLADDLIKHIATTFSKI